MMDSDKKNRRTVLQTSGSVLLSTGLLAGIGTSRSSASEKLKFKLRGTKQDPVSKDELRRRRKNAIQSYYESGKKVSVVGIEEKDDILAYNFVATRNLGIKEYFYTANLSSKQIQTPQSDISPQSTTDRSDIELQTTVVSPDADGIERRAHRSADKWLETEKNPIVASQYNTTSTVASNPSLDDFRNWNSRGSVYDTHEEPPYGIITEQYTLKESPDQDDVYGVNTNVDIEAGENQLQHGDDNYDPDRPKTGPRRAYRIRKAKIRHDWDSSMSHEDSMRDRSPRGELSDATESYSASLGIDGNGNGNIGFSYGYSSKADTITDESSQSDNIGRWKMKLNPRSRASRNNAFYNPASLAIIDSSGCSSPGGHTVVDLPLDVTFQLTSLFNATWTIGTDKTIPKYEHFETFCAP